MTGFRGDMLTVGIQQDELLMVYGHKIHQPRLRIKHTFIVH